ncbi:MAG: flagellar motor switch protein FliM [Candidatus Tectomicrobia bacterium]|nr:flagellar motor switch protein FliM [Candidatus Tectomicrobia bacterium]
MNQILSQAEVDALLKGVVEGEVKTGTDPGPAAGEVVPFDLTSQGKVKRDPMPSFDMIQEKLGRRMRVTLTTSLQRPVDVNFLTSAFVKLGDLVKSLPLPTSLHIFRMEPLHGLAMLVVESRLVYDMIDAFFGGRGQFQSRVEGRDYTGIELRMMRKVVKQLLLDVEKTWQVMLPVRTVVEREEAIPQFASIAPPAEVVVVAHFEVEIEQMQRAGRISICIPYSMLEPIRHKLNTGFQTKEEGVDDTWRRRIAENVAGTQVEIAVELGGAEISVRELLTLAAGDLIQLTQDAGAKLVVNVEGVRKFLGHAGSLKGSKAVQVATRLHCQQA